MPGSLRELLDELRRRNLLIEIHREINKDTELMPLVRWQYRGLSAGQRRGFLFTNVVDAQGHRYEAGVAVAVVGASRAVYAAAIGVAEAEIGDRWIHGLRQPLEPVMVSPAEAPVKDVVLQGDQLREHGLRRLPFPVSTPGFDPGPYVTAGCWITKDPETGIRNVATLRGMIKGDDRVAALILPTQHIGIHFQKWRQRRQAMPVAICIGAPPCVAAVSVAKIPYGVDEVTVAGALAGHPVQLVKCDTVDLEVPAQTEIVLEGTIDPEYLEPEGPFGEFTGYVGEQMMAPVVRLNCITHRRDPLLHTFISQFPPSESSLIRAVSFEANLYNLMHNQLGLSGVKDVALLECSGGWQFCVIQIHKGSPSEPWQALHAAAALDPTVGKIFVAVDDDVDPHEPESVIWALSFRMQPHLDMSLTNGRASLLDPSSAPPSLPAIKRYFPEPRGASAILIDATRKWDYPPTSLPTQEWMERARRIWEEEDLPELTPRYPWFGTILGTWPEEQMDAARLAVEGRFMETVCRYAERNRVRAPSQESGK